MDWESVVRGEIDKARSKGEGNHALYLLSMCDAALDGRISLDDFSWAVYFFKKGGGVPPIVAVPEGTPFPAPRGEIAYGVALATLQLLKKWSLERQLGVGPARLDAVLLEDIKDCEHSLKILLT